MTIKVLIYARVSSVEQAKKGSLENQILSCKKKATELGYGQLEIRIFKEAFSGKNTDRPELDKLFEFIEKNPSVKYLIIYDIDRLTRGGGQELNKIKSTLKKFGVELLDFNGVISGKSLNLIQALEIEGLKGFDDSGYDWATRNLSADAEEFAANSAEKERIKIHQRTQPAAIKILWEGWLVREADYGYKGENSYDSGQKRRVGIIYKPEAKYIRQMYELLINGFTSKQVCKKLNDKGYKSRKRKRGGENELTTKTLGQIIRKPVYAGFNYEKRTNGFAVKAQHEPIVSIEEWNLANEKLGIKTLKLIKDETSQHFKLIKLIRSKRRYQGFNSELPLRMLITSPYEAVGLTGSFSTSASKKRNNGYYHTTKKAHTSYRVRSDDVHNWFSTVLRNITFAPQSVTIFEQQIINAFSELQDTHIQRQEEKVGRLKSLEQEKKRLFDKFNNTDSKYFIKMLETNIKVVEEKIQDIESSQVEERMTKRQFEQILKRALKVIEQPLNLMNYMTDKTLMSAFMLLIFHERPSPEDLKNRTYKLTLLMRANDVQYDINGKVVSPLGIEPRSKD